MEMTNEELEELDKLIIEFDLLNLDASINDLFNNI